MDKIPDAMANRIAFNKDVEVTKARTEKLALERELAQTTDIAQQKRLKEGIARCENIISYHSPK
jgi:hypothetical protein